eukprot:UN22718
MFCLISLTIFFVLVLYILSNYRHFYNLYLCHNYIIDFTPCVWSSERLLGIYWYQHVQKGFKQFRDIMGHHKKMSNDLVGLVTEFLAEDERGEVPKEVERLKQFHLPIIPHMRDTSRHLTKQPSRLQLRRHLEALGKKYQSGAFDTDLLDAEKKYLLWLPSLMTDQNTSDEELDMITIDEGSSRPTHGAVPDRQTFQEEYKVVVAVREDREDKWKIQILVHLIL